MNKEQQELYEKLLKKVDEFCLGQAAEDVIAAIDDLVDTYENKKTKYLFISIYDSGWYIGVNDNGNCESDLKKVINEQYYRLPYMDFKNQIIKTYESQYDIIVYSDNGEMEVLKWKH